ncbi:hypothetical protein [Prescottella subtropica]|uniref:hypothetical protein n=1 Tax=Prescottella subtropica TaxID=2545757 RepID=UPI0010F81405|nr:hypothetical protein [Prescottella subtropica]
MSARQPISPAWIEQAASELAVARRQLRHRQIELASTARGAHNLLLEAQALEACGQVEQAEEVRRTVTRGFARRRAADVAENPAAADGWTPPTVRGGGGQCPACGQFAAAAHRCPPAILEARRQALSPTGDMPSVQAGVTDEGSAAAASLAAGFYRDIPLTDADAEAIAAVCADNLYGPPVDDLPSLPRHADGSIDVDSAAFAAHRDAALARTQDACFEDEYIDGIPVPVVLSQGALEPFAVPAKREVATQLGNALADADDAELFDTDECAALAAPETAQWGSTTSGLCWRTGDGEPWRQIGTGERVTTPNVMAADPALVRAAARQTVASQAMAAWAAHTERDVAPAAVHTQAAVRDVFVQPNPDPPQTVEARRARAIVRAQYAVTQRYLADRGVSEVSVSRGMWFSTSGDAPAWVPASKGERSHGEVALNPASSFTTRSEVSSYFARREWDDDEYVSVRLHGTVPASRVLSLPRTGMGCLSEEEIVVIGGHGQWEVERV